MTDHVTDLLDAVDRDRQLWPAVDVRLLALFVDGAWRNLATQVYLRSTRPDQTARLPHPVRTELLRAEQHVLPVTELPGLLAAVTEGRWPDTEDGITFRDERASAPYAFRHAQFFSLDYPYARPHYQWSGHVIRAEGDSGGSLINRVPGAHDALSNIARRHRYPFRSLDDLASHVLDLPAAFVASQNSWCEVFAPYEVRIDRESVRLEEQHVHYRLLAGSLNAAQAARLQVLGQPPETGVPAENVIEADTKWETGRSSVSCYRGRSQIAADGGADLVLHCGAQTVEWVQYRAYRVADRAVPFLAYESLDPDLKLLKEALHAHRKSPERQGRFEAAVGRLFTLAGWLVDILHDKRLSDAVDVIAHHQTRHVCLAIECTTGPLDSDKLSRLVLRLSELRSCLGDVEVLGVVATSTELSGLFKPELRAAASHGILVLHRAALLGMAEAVNAGASSTELLELVRREGSAAALTADR